MTSSRSASPLETHVACDVASSEQVRILRHLRAWFDGRISGAGARCEEHGIVHVGKLAFWLLDACRESLPLARVRDVAHALLGTLRRHPHLPDAYVFGPGPDDRANPSNHPIDSGSVVAALAAFHRGYEADLDAEERLALRTACERCAETYLLPTARTKAVLPQRTWALWGAAEATRLLGRDDWRAGLRAAVDAVVREQRADGSFPYVSASAQGPTTPGTRGASAFYHSRVLGFCGLAEDALGERLVPAEVWRRSATWLRALFTQDGRKVRVPDVKEFYFDGEDEVVSFPFDVVHQMLAARRVGDGGVPPEVPAMLATYARHLDARGVRPHLLEERAFQCRTFFAAHGLFLAAVVVPEGDPATRSGTAEVHDLRATGLLHRVDERGRALWLRTSEECGGVYQGRARVGHLVRHAGGREPIATVELLRLWIGQRRARPTWRELRFAWHVARSRARGLPRGNRWLAAVDAFLVDLRAMRRVRPLEAPEARWELVVSEERVQRHVRMPAPGVAEACLTLSFGDDALGVEERYALAQGRGSVRVSWEAPAGARATRGRLERPGEAIARSLVAAPEAGWSQRVPRGARITWTYDLPWSRAS